MIVAYFYNIQYDINFPTLLLKITLNVLHSVNAKISVLFTEICYSGAMRTVNQIQF